MRVRGVNIRSFGALRERRYELSDGMTVFHGPNESGTSTRRGTSPTPER